VSQVEFAVRHDRLCVACLAARRRESQPPRDVVQAPLEQAQQLVARDALAAGRAVEDPAELALAQA
jgi:hypothetical protein